MNLEPGMLAESKAGHDTGRIYVIIKVENEYVYLADGRSRPVRLMKKKNRKHLQAIKKMRAANLEDDAAIKKVIDYYTRRREGQEPENQED